MSDICIMGIKVGKFVKLTLEDGRGFQGRITKNYGGSLMIKVADYEFLFERQAIKEVQIIDLPEDAKP